jgi:hypothetical protein
LLIDILKGLKAGPPRYFKVLKNAIPDDAELVGARISDLAPALVVMELESAQWSPDKNGAELDEPVLQAVTSPIIPP